jgi:hypothetical protein
MYELNVNKVHTELKRFFEDVKVDTSDYRKILYRCEKPLEGDKFLEMKILVDTKNINNIDPILEWSYYTNPNAPDNLISFRSKSEGFGSVLNQIISEKRFDENYLKLLENKNEEFSKLNESLENQDTEVGNTEFIEKNGDNWFVSETAIKEILSEFGLVLDEIHMKIFNPEGGIRGTYLNDEPQLGDTLELEMELSPKSFDGEILPSKWIKIGQKFNGLECVEDVFVSTMKNRLTVHFQCDNVIIELGK